MRGFSYGYTPSSVQMNEVGQNSRANMADPIAIPNLDDPKKQEKIRKESNRTIGTREGSTEA